MPVAFNADNTQVRFLAGYYQQRLAVYEHIAFSGYTRKQLLDIGLEASSLKKFLLDCYEEGYQCFVDLIALPLNTLERLEKFLQRLLQFLGETSEQELFHLFPEVIEHSLLQSTHFEGETFELSALLESLEPQTLRPVDISDCFSDPQHLQQWQAKTALLMDEMLAFMGWTLKHFRHKPSGWVPVFLLRDTLILYFGYVWLFRNGLLPESPQPLLLNRKFLMVTEGTEDTYETVLLESLYEALSEHPQDVADFCKLAGQHLHDKALPLSFQRETRAYVQRLVGSRPIFMVESGLHGSVPMWVLNQCENQGTFLMYTTAPWLREVYRENTFHQNYNYLRDMETSAAQNYLFQFRSIENQRILVNKTSKPHIEKLALYELHHFRMLLEKSNFFS
ncbi:MAG: hypothetical protein ACOYOS_10815 [Syntrophales bacterium]